MFHCFFSCADLETKKQCACKSILYKHTSIDNREMWGSKIESCTKTFLPVFEVNLFSLTGIDDFFGYEDTVTAFTSIELTG